MVNLPLRKWLFISVGVLSVGLGTAGIFLPLLPTTPFLLLAAACFIRSSNRLYLWLITHKWFGPYIKNYREYNAITKGTKVVILLLLWGTLCYSAIWVISTLHVLSLKSLPRELLSKRCRTKGVDG
jgi:uncharacterized membrane protein YbaN (DUF454 family)